MNPQLYWAVEETILASRIFFSQIQRENLSNTKRSHAFFEKLWSKYCFFLWMDGVKKKMKKLMTFKWRWKIASFYFWITLQDCLDKEYNFHMICIIIINLILSARGMKPTSASTFLLLTCWWWRLRIPLLRIMNGADAALFPKLNGKKISPTRYYYLFFNVPYVLYPKIFVNNWGGTSALLNCTLNARKIQTNVQSRGFRWKRNETMSEIYKKNSIPIHSVSIWVIIRFDLCALKHTTVMF